MEKSPENHRTKIPVCHWSLRHEWDNVALKIASRAYSDIRRIQIQ